jgi:hypothetical protein
MKLRSRRDVCTQPINYPVKITVILSGADLQQLKMTASEHKTTVNEIIRALVADFLDGKMWMDDDGEQS